MNAVKTIFFMTILLCGFYCSPIERDILMEKESTLCERTQERSNNGQLCRKSVIVFCELQKKYFNPKHRLNLYEKCLFDGFTQKCGYNISY